MIKRVLIAEDYESSNISIQKTLDSLNIKSYEYVYYCDDALSRIKKSIAEGNPYDLLVTDISFDEDHNKQQLKNGEELIEATKILQPKLKVIVFSAENKPANIKRFFDHLKIDGFVRKGRNDAKELQVAFNAVNNNQSYLAADIKKLLQNKNSFDFTDLDIQIINFLSIGKKQKDIPAELEKLGIKPNSLRTIEKRLELMKQCLEFNTNEQLIVFAIDLGII